jgi:hypothetical protein
MKSTLQSNDLPQQMAETVLFDTIGSIIRSLGSLALQEIGLLWGFKDELQKLGDTISTIHISHLLFADDTLVFCGASLDQVQAIRNLLVCFELVSGLNVNWAKFVAMPVGNVGNVVALAEVLG